MIAGRPGNRFKEIIQILETATAWFAKEQKPRAWRTAVYQFMRAHRANFTISLVAEAFQVGQCDCSVWLKCGQRMVANHGSVNLVPHHSDQVSLSVCRGPVNRRIERISLCP